MRTLRLTSPFAYPPRVAPPPVADRTVETMAELTALTDVRHGERILVRARSTVFEFVSETQAYAVSGLVHPAIVRMDDGARGQYWVRLDPLLPGDRW